jgi:hypothetical protein
VVPFEELAAELASELIEIEPDYPGDDAQRLGHARLYSWLDVSLTDYDSREQMFMGTRFIWGFAQFSGFARAACTWPTR